MNTIERIDDTNFEVTTETGDVIKATLIYEKKTGEYHIKLPMPNATGRQFIRLKKFLAGETTFENKTAPPRVLGQSTNREAPVKWADHMTPEEAEEAKKAYETLEKITKAVKDRISPPKGTKEWYALEIAKMKAALEKLNETKEVE
jgi:hypothetical protein